MEPLIEPKVGDVIRLDGKISERLLQGDEYVDSGYAGCQFRYPLSNGGPIKSVAINIEITGRTWQRYNGAFWVRAKIEFVGDCEPSTFGKGWIKIRH